MLGDDRKRHGPCSPASHCGVRWSHTMKAQEYTVHVEEEKRQQQITALPHLHLSIQSEGTWFGLNWFQWGLLQEQKRGTVYVLPFISSHMFLLTPVLQLLRSHNQLAEEVNLAEKIIYRLIYFFFFVGLGFISTEVLVLAQKMWQELMWGKNTTAYSSSSLHWDHPKLTEKHISYWTVKFQQKMCLAAMLVWSPLLSTLLQHRTSTPQRLCSKDLAFIFSW